MGNHNTMGFVGCHMIYGLVWVLPIMGYSVYGFGYGVGKADPWVVLPQLKLMFFKKMRLPWE